VSASVKDTPKAVAVTKERPQKGDKHLENNFAEADHLAQYIVNAITEKELVGHDKQV
jgi:hypothetical protein